jgi:UDP-N-acetylmuramoyl-tripeptide--D-alanyl-D-alanine ligase
MSFWTPDTVRQGAGGAWARRPQVGESVTLAGLAIDSRTVRPGQVFLALRGERFDGADFIGEALDARAAMVVTERPERVPVDRPVPGGVVRVPDAGKALLRLAGAYRRTLEATKVVGITGSNGKTTTTRLVHSVLSARLRGSASQKSFNNAVGVPLTVLAVRSGDQFLAAEAGINAPGEMAELAEVLRPDIGVIVSIGRAHIEALGSVEGISREKSILLRAVPSGGCCIAPADAPELADFLKGLPGLVTFGRAQHADLRLTDVRHAPVSGGGPGIRFTVNDRHSYELPMVGEHNALNALAAIAVGRRMGLDHDTIGEGLRRASAPEMRLSLGQRGDVQVLNDAYNANPDSAVAAVRALVEVCRGARRRVVVLGDMLELGGLAEEAHREVAEVAGTLGIELFVGVGSFAGPAAARAGELLGRDRALSLPDLSEQSLARLIAMLQPGDAVLLKGSRRSGLERVDEALARRSAPGESAPEPKPRARAKA